MAQGVCMMMLGQEYRLALWAALWTLRQHYDGDVAVFSDDPSLKPPTVQHVIHTPRDGTRHQQCKVKSRIARLSPFDSTLWLDTDTLTVGDIRPLFLPAGDERIRAVQHADWTTKHTQMSHRLNELAAHGIIHPAQAAKLVEANTPAINSGVYAVTRATAICAEWERTVPGLDPFFLHDEFALQVLLHKYPHEVWDDRWNCHPMWSRRNAAEVVIWHCCMQRYGRPQTADLWFRTLREMWAENFGGVRDWWRGNPALWQGQE